MVAINQLKTRKTGGRGASTQSFEEKVAAPAHSLDDDGMVRRSAKSLAT